MRMEPGAVTIAHDHAGMDEFLIIEWDLVDSDGTTFGPGDFVSYDAGTHHNSWTERGYLIAVFEWRVPTLPHVVSAETTPRIVGRYDAAANAAAFRDCRDRNLQSQISICGMRRAASSAAPSRSSWPG